jgi:hypothetical protein
MAPKLPSYIQIRNRLANRISNTKKNPHLIGCGGREVDIVDLRLARWKGGEAAAKTEAAALIKQLEEKLAAKSREVEQLTAGRKGVDQQLAAKQLK